MKVQAGISGGAYQSTLTQVAQNAADVQLKAAAQERVSLIIVNNSAANLYVAFAAAVTTAAFTYKIAPNGTLELPQPIWNGQIHGIWDAAGAGSAVITELF